MIDVIKVVLLGIVEGLTEFLPVSSTGHLIVAVALLRPGFNASADSTFVLFIQFGAVVAVGLYYLRDLLGQARAIPTDAGVRRFWLNIIMAVIPAAVVGFLLRDFIKDVLFTPVVVAIMLIAGGVLFILFERTALAARAAEDDMMQITSRQAILIGVAQTAALIPGVSRAAASILGGMMVGMSRTAATRFSFFLAIPTLGGATLVDLLLSLDEIGANDWGYFILGALVAGGVAWLSIGWLLRYVSRSSFVPFGWYRIIAGLVILALAAVGVL